ncbi:MAG: tyrosine-type recombinase/integrase [Bacteroidota bacterium]|nr:tyrosine-type recombinase/integrase [Bacteroidota bacterium]
MRIETLEHYLNKRHTEQTTKTYVYYIDVFLMKNKNAKGLLYGDILNYINELKTSTGDVSNLSTKLASIKRYYDYLLETGQRNDHPCRNIRLKRKKKPVQLQDLFTSSELELLMNRENRYKDLELRNKVTISLLIYQALSGSELIRLQIKNINLDEGTIYIKGSKKIASRTLNLKPNQIMLIQRYMDTSRQNLMQSETDCLLITQRGVPETVDGVNSMIQPLKGLFPDRNLNPMTIRQSVISNLLNEHRKSIEDVQLFAGHRWPSTTEQYRRKNIDEQREMINMLHPLG